MNYIYNIIVNFNPYLLDFYEWNKNDKISKIKRVPIIKISSKSLNILKKYKCKINKYYPLCIFTDEKEAIAFKFNKEKICISKSKLLFETEEEVLYLSNRLKYKKIKYYIIKKDKYFNRKDIIKRKILYSIIKNNKDVDKLKYIYYDCFNKIEVNPKYKLLSLLDKKWDEIGNKIYDFFFSLI